MCTAIAYKGKDDILYGFNMDLDPAVWKYSVHKTGNLFAVGITVGSTTYYVHGVNKNGNFSNTPYMNGEVFTVEKGLGRERIDLMSDRYIRAKYSFSDIENILDTKSVVGIPSATMHSLIGNKDGDFLIVEPGYGHVKVQGNYAVLSNFPVLANLKDFSNPFYGKDRYDKALSMLKDRRSLSVSDMLGILDSVRQTGKWGTRVSFVYSSKDNAVSYFLNGDISTLQVHHFQ